MINYSPYPRSSYRWVIGGHSYGPATSPLMDTQESWNLAYLSFNYESQRDHPDPQFSTNVRRTAQWKMDGSGPDLTGMSRQKTVASLLRLPAPRFVYLINKHPLLEALPLYKAYGQAWLQTISERSWLCKTEDYVPPPVHSVLEASTLLASVMRK